MEEVDKSDHTWLDSEKNESDQNKLCHVLLVIQSLQNIVLDMHGVFCYKYFKLKAASSDIEYHDLYLI